MRAVAVPVVVVVSGGAVAVGVLGEALEEVGLAYEGAPDPLAGLLSVQNDGQ